MESKKYKVAVIGGDGIGPEVCDAAKRVMQRTAELDGHIAFEFTDVPWGCTWYKENGRMMPEDGLEILKGFDAILLGAVGRPDVPDHVSLHGLLIAVRQGFDQYVNLRPVKLLKGSPSTSSASGALGGIWMPFAIYSDLVIYSNAFRALRALNSGLLHWFSSAAKQKR